MTNCTQHGILRGFVRNYSYAQTFRLKTSFSRKGRKKKTNETRNERRSITRTWHLCSHIQFRQDESSHRKLNVYRARKHAANFFNHFLTEKLHKDCITLQLTETRNCFVGCSVNYIVLTAVSR